VAGSWGRPSLTDMNKNAKAFKAYLIAGHIVWLIITPLLLFIGGGSWLINRFNWYSWLMIVFIILGLTAMVSGVASYLKQLLEMYYGENSENPEQKKVEQLKVDKSDYDYNN
jgi:F0F1-type ATP synthase assembly protein I